MEGKAHRTRPDGARAGSRAARGPRAGDEPARQPPPRAPLVPPARCPEALARAELLALRRHGKRWQPLWALTPRPKDDPAAQDDIGAITAKIKSKMDTAKVFGPFLTALLTFVATQFASTPTQSPFWWPMVRGVSLAALGVGAGSVLLHDALLV